MFRKKRNDVHTYGIVGLGKFGYALALELADSGADLIVIDDHEDVIREMREYTENAYIINKLDKKSLAETGIQNCDVAVCGIGEHIDSSILTTLTLVSLGIPHVIAKATSADHGEILEKLGAEVVYPERDIAKRLAHRLEASRVLDYIQLSEKLNISKLLVPNAFIGQSVKMVDVRGRFGLNIIAIENGTRVNSSVSSDYTFKSGDILYICGSKEGLEKMSEED